MKRESVSNTGTGKDIEWLKRSVEYKPAETEKKSAEQRKNELVDSLSVKISSDLRKIPSFNYNSYINPKNIEKRKKLVKKEIANLLNWNSPSQKYIDDIVTRLDKKLSLEYFDNEGNPKKVNQEADSGVLSLDGLSKPIETSIPDPVKQLNFAEIKAGLEGSGNSMLTRLERLKTVKTIFANLNDVGKLEYFLTDLKQSQFEYLNSDVASSKRADVFYVLNGKRYTEGEEVPKLTEENWNSFLQVVEAHLENLKKIKRVETSVPIESTKPSEFSSQDSEHFKGTTGDFLERFDKEYTKDKYTPQDIKDRYNHFSENSTLEFVNSNSDENQIRIRRRIYSIFTGIKYANGQPVPRISDSQLQAYFAILGYGAGEIDETSFVKKIDGILRQDKDTNVESTSTAVENGLTAIEMGEISDILVGLRSKDPKSSHILSLTKIIGKIERGHDFSQEELIRARKDLSDAEMYVGPRENFKGSTQSVASNNESKEDKARVSLQVLVDKVEAFISNNRDDFESLRRNDFEKDQIQSFYEKLIDEPDLLKDIFTDSDVMLDIFDYRAEVKNAEELLAIIFQQKLKSITIQAKSGFWSSIQSGLAAGFTKAFESKENKIRLDHLGKIISFTRRKRMDATLRNGKWATALEDYRKLEDLRLNNERLRTNFSSLEKFEQVRQMRNLGFTIAGTLAFANYQDIIDVPQFVNATWTEWLTLVAGKSLLSSAIGGPLAATYAKLKASGEKAGTGTTKQARNVIITSMIVGSVIPASVNTFLMPVFQVGAEVLGKLFGNIIPKLNPITSAFSAERPNTRLKDFLNFSSKNPISENVISTPVEPRQAPIIFPSGLDQNSTSGEILNRINSLGTNGIKSLDDRLISRLSPQEVSDIAPDKIKVFNGWPFSKEQTSSMTREQIREITSKQIQAGGYGPFSLLNENQRINLVQGFNGKVAPIIITDVDKNVIENITNGITNENSREKLGLWSLSVYPDNSIALDSPNIKTMEADITRSLENQKPVRSIPLPDINTDPSVVIPLPEIGYRSPSRIQESYRSEISTTESIPPATKSVGIPEILNVNKLPRGLSQAFEQSLQGQNIPGTERKFNLSATRTLMGNLEVFSGKKFINYFESQLSGESRTLGKLMQSSDRKVLMNMLDRFNNKNLSSAERGKLILDIQKSNYWATLASQKGVKINWNTLLELAKETKLPISGRDLLERAAEQVKTGK